MIILYRKIRSRLRSLLYLPKFIMWGNAKINTRHWATSSFLLFGGRLYEGKARGDYEPETTKLFNKEISNAKVFWDFGSNVGYYSILAAQRGITTYAFEIMNELAKELSKHSKNNNLNIKVFNIPIGRKNQTISYSDGYTSSTKKAISIDELSCGIPDLIKMDIEGGEYDAICGGENLLRNHSPKLIIELNDNLSDCEAIINKLKEFGYDKKSDLDISTFNRNVFFEKTK